MVSKINKSPKTIQKKNFAGWISTLKSGLTHLPLIFFLFFSITNFSSKTYGQAGDLSQIRNGNGKVKNGVLDTCGSCWVNGNAGAQTAHYVEGMSIAYRSLVTGLTAGVCYEYELGYDTYHSAMAIDYLTHFQRLEPHSPFNHPAEVINPLALVSGSTSYTMTTTSTHTFPIPAPAPSGIVSGAFNADGSARDISNQAATSFNALPAAQRLFTIYNGEIQNIFYVSEAPIVIGGADAETRLRVRFMANSDSVMLAWGGHIASRLDWGFTKDNKGNLSPLSAAGISGSPYHMRQKAFDRVDCAFTTGHVLENISGFGNQDRSLSAAAVIPPPECPTVPSQTKCLDATSFTFTISNPDAGTTYTWSFGTNTAGAAFSGGANTGTSVTIVPSGSAFTAGSFTLNITAVKNSISLVCTGVATGTVVQVVATATANPTTIDITSAAHNTTLTADIDASSTDPNNANYSYQWSIVTAGTTGVLLNATSRIATYTAGVGDAGSTIQFKVIATQTAAPNCSDDALVSVNVSSGSPCDVSPQAAVCQGTTTTHNGSPNPKPATATYTWSLEANGGGGTTASTLVGGNSGGVTQQVNANESYRIVLTQVYDNPALNTSCFEDVTVVPTPTVSAIYNPPGCTENTFSIDVPNSVVGSSYRVTQGGEITPTYDQTKAGDGGTLNFSGLAAGGGFLVRVTTGTASCTATTDCAGSTNSCNSNGARDASTPVTSVVKPVDKLAETYKIILESPTKVKAVPNPFTDKIRFNLVSGVSGYGSLELYNILGQKIGVVYQGFVQAGRELNKEYNIPKDQRNTLIYVFKVGDQKVTGKLLGLK